MTRPSQGQLRKASLRAVAPAACSFQGLQFLRGRMTAAALRAAMAAWPARVSYAPVGGHDTDGLVVGVWSSSMGASD